jgi:hypothetical protein
MATAAAKIVPIKKPKLTLGALIDKMSDIREVKRKVDESSKELKAQYDVLEVQLMEMLDGQDTRKGEGKKASASISESVQPNVVDWDSFYAYIFKNKFTHLLQRRPSAEACRELFETKGKIPGVEPFTKRTINLRNL